MEIIHCIKIIITAIIFIYWSIIITRAADYGFFNKKTYLIFSDYKNMKQLQKEKK